MRNSAGVFCPDATGSEAGGWGMIYSKKALTQEDQADLLLARGLIASRSELINRLRAVNYYRLSAYLYPFRQPDNSFRPGTTLDMVWRRYSFDRRLRIILLDAIERIEVALRTRLVYHFVQAHGPFGHLDEKNLPGFNKLPVWKRLQRNLTALRQFKGRPRSDHAQWLAKLQAEKSRSSRAKSAFTIHFEKTLGTSIRICRFGWHVS